MKCTACDKEVALAKVCPYCGAPVDQAKQAESSTHKGPKGRFVGSVHEESSQAKRSQTSVGRVARYFLDARIPAWRKMLIVLAFIYVLSPIDLLPGAIFPGLGWFDDIAVIGIAWQWIGRELRMLDRE